MKYDGQLQELSKVLSSAKNVLVALPPQATLDHLAAGLALFLSLKLLGKEASIVTEDIIRVGHSHLFGVGQIQNKLTPTRGGNLVVTLGGVATGDDQIPVPVLEKLDWYKEGYDLNLVFHVLPGQRFEPTHITPRPSFGGYEVILVVGVPQLNALGSIYVTDQGVFATHVVNLDNQPQNTQFGTTNVVDPAVSLSEIAGWILLDLSLPFDGDVGSNILAGVFAATGNLTGGKVGADTYTLVGEALRKGGQKPQSLGLATVGMEFVQPQTPISTPLEKQPTYQPSPEEVPMGEEVVTPSPDWLVPKVFRGGGN